MSISLTFECGEFSVDSGLALTPVVGEYSPNAISLLLGVGERAPWDPIWVQLSGVHELGIQRPIAQLTGQHELGVDKPLLQLTGSHHIYVAKNLVGQTELRAPKQLTGQHKIYNAKELLGRSRLAAVASLIGQQRVFVSQEFSGQHRLGVTKPAKQLIGQHKITSRIASQFIGSHQIGQSRSAARELHGRHRIASQNHSVQSGFKVVIKNHAS